MRHSGPCLCGDTRCPSCGPAQGNTKCIICGAWAEDGCEHFNDEGVLKPEFEQLVHGLELRMANEESADFEKLADVGDALLDEVRHGERDPETLKPLGDQS